jgi:hypothetical protein
MMRDFETSKIRERFDMKLCGTCKGLKTLRKDGESELSREAWRGVLLIPRGLFNVPLFHGEDLRI